MEIETPKVFPCFNIGHHAGQVNQAVTLEGIKVYREKSLWIPELGEVLCTPDQDHFVYEEPTGKEGRPSYLCTCGSLAVVVGPETHKRFSSLKCKMLMCHAYMLYGKHATSLGEFKYGKQS
jgi:hypothetical protein